MTDLTSGPPTSDDGTVVGTLPAGEPITAVPRRWIARFSLVWFGYWMANLVPVQLLLPSQLNTLDPAHKVRDLGVVSGLTGVVAVLALPLFGALCDRTRTRFGQRRVWMAGGVALYALGLLLTGAQSSWQGVGLAWLVATLGASMATAGLTATIADAVLASQRGVISGAVYGPQAVSIVVGLVVITAITSSAALSYAILAGVLIACAVPFVLRYRDVPPGTESLPLSLRGLAEGMWISPRRHPDFAWAFGGRTLVNLGNAFGTTYLFFFLQDSLHVADPEGSLVTLTLIYLVFTLVATYLAGFASDRSGKRRRYVAMASGLQAIACFVLAFFPSFGTAMVSAGLLGAGYGAFMSVDQALVTAVLPSALSRAKDLGIMNAGSAGPQALAPLGASLVIGSLGGYGVLFGVAGVTTVLGAAMVYRIHSVP